MKCCITTMQLIFLLGALTCTALAKPEGYYHQQSEFHSSSSAFRNNELQHKKDDDAFYSEAGDLEGKSKPKVNSYDHHSEYTNPRLRNQQTSTHLGLDDSQFATSQTDRLASHLGTSYGVKGGHSSFGAQTSYGTASDLQDLTRRLETDLSEQIHRAVSEQYSRSSSYSSTQSRQDLQVLEDELKANLTRQLQEALYAKYGQQRIRGPYSYSLTAGGRTNPTANYDNEELDDLKEQLQRNLMRELQQTVRTQSQTSSSSYSSGYAGGYNQRQTLPLSANAGRTESLYPSLDEMKTTSNQNRFNSYDGTYESSYPAISITEVATEVQRVLSEQIDEVLEEEQRRNLQMLQQRKLPNYTETFEFLKGMLKRNLTVFLDEQIRKNYGPQIVEGPASYSTLPNGQRKTRPNFRLTDLETLKQQVEDNLVEKLSYGIRQHEIVNAEEHSRVTSSTGYSSGYYNSRPYRPQTYNTQTNDGYSQTSQTSNRQSSTNYQRPLYVSQPIQPLSTASQTNNGYRVGVLDVANNPNSEVELHNLQREVQDDLTRQLQSAIRETKREFRLYSSSNSGSASGATPSPANYQATLDELSEELKRNLTEKLHRSLQRSSASASGSYSYSGGSSDALDYNSQQVQDLARQMQNDLLKQLEDGLHQTMYSQYSSYSSSRSSSSGHVRPGGVKTAGYRSADTSGYGSQRYGQYADDCEYTRRKRHVGRFDESQRSEVETFEPVQRAERPWRRNHRREDFTDDVQRADTQQVEDLESDYRRMHFVRKPRYFRDDFERRRHPWEQSWGDYGHHPHHFNHHRHGPILPAVQQNTEGPTSAPLEEFTSPVEDEGQQQVLEPLQYVPRRQEVDFRSQRPEENEELTQQIEEEDVLKQVEEIDTSTRRNAHQYQQESRDHPIVINPNLQFHGFDEVPNAGLNSGVVQEEEPMVPHPIDHQVEEFPTFDNHLNLDSQSQRADDMQQLEDLTQQFEEIPTDDDLVQRNEDLTQQQFEPLQFGSQKPATDDQQQVEEFHYPQQEHQTEDLVQKHENPQPPSAAFTQQTEDHDGLLQETQRDDMVQKYENLNPPSGELTQQLETEEFGAFQVGSQTNPGSQISDLTQRNEKLEVPQIIENQPETIDDVQQNEQIAENVNLDQQAERFDGNDGFVQQLEPIDASFARTAPPKTYLQEVEPLQPVHEELIVPQTAYETTNTVDFENITPVKTNEPKNPEKSPGFWKKIGNGFENAYNTVKNQAIAIKDKIF